MQCMTAKNTVRLRAGSFRDALAELGYSSPSAFAVQHGLAPSTLSRCLRGKSAAGPVVVATVLQVTGKPFADLFVLDAGDEPERDAA